MLPKSVERWSCQWNGSTWGLEVVKLSVSGQGFISFSYGRSQGASALITSPATELDNQDDIHPTPEPAQPYLNLEEDHHSTSLGDFREMDLEDKQRRGKPPARRSKKVAK